MQNKINYDKIMKTQLDDIKKKYADMKSKPKLLLHVCCAPCASGVLDELIEYFDLSILFYNPNITDNSEYNKRYNELINYIKERNYEINIYNGRYEPTKDYFDKIKGFENVKEGHERCFICYELRMEETAKFAKENKFDYFSTVLSISPLKNATVINSIGEKLQNIYNIDFLHCDFKKKQRFLKSIKLSEEFALYRQNYCGCIFSKNERNNWYKKSKEY